MANVTFIRGSRANYDGTGKHADGIYFAEDTLEILMNGQSYGLSGGGSITSITLQDTDMTITMEDGSSASVRFPLATADTPGWMSAYDASQLANLSNTIRDAINNAIAGLKHDDEVESGKFVTSVTESDGVIETTKGSVTSEDGSVTVTPTDSGDIDLSVKFPEETLYTGKDAIDVTDYVVSLTLDSETEGFLSVGSTGLKLSGVQEAIDAVQSTAEEAETLAESALTEAKTYTDTEVSSVKEYVEENYIPNTEKGHSNGVAELDEYGYVLSSQLPSYVDDVLDYPSIDDFPDEGENGKIYIATDTNLTYRWSGSDYVEISASLALGTTAETAGRGDWTVAAYDHAQITDGSNPHKTTFDNLEGTEDVLGSITTAQSTADSAASAASNAQSTADEALKAVEDIDLTPYVMSDEVKNVVLVSALPSSPVTTTLYLIPEE